MPSISGRRILQHSETDHIERSIQELAHKRRVVVEGSVVEVALLVRVEDWRPLRASWWKGKEVVVVGVDLDGNFFLRHSGGSVFLWRHSDGRAVFVASSVRRFVLAITE